MAILSFSVNLGKHERIQLLLEDRGEGNNQQKAKCKTNPTNKWSSIKEGHKQNIALVTQFFHFQENNMKIRL